jgi:hypothetical protein
MSSVYKQGNSYLLQVGVGRARRVRRLGDLSRDGAKTVEHHVEQIERSRKAAVSLPSSTATWLGDITDDLHAKLAALGLVASRSRPDNGGIPATIGRLWDDFFARRPDLKKWTLSNLEQTKLRCIEFFKLKPVAAITKGMQRTSAVGSLTRNIHPQRWPVLSTRLANSSMTRSTTDC